MRKKNNLSIVKSEFFWWSSYFKPRFCHRTFSNKTSHVCNWQDPHPSRVLSIQLDLSFFLSNDKCVTKVQKVPSLLHLHTLLTGQMMAVTKHSKCLKYPCASKGSCGWSFFFFKMKCPKQQLMIKGAQLSTWWQFETFVRNMCPYLDILPHNPPHSSLGRRRGGDPVSQGSLPHI